MPGDTNTRDGDDAWMSVRAMAERGDVSAMLATIRAIPEGQRRIALYRSTIRHLAFDAWANRDLDVMVALADAAIAECELVGGDLLQEANVLSFNMAANLADCWADEFVREPHHFEKGIEYARNALAFRNQLERGPDAEAMAAWGLGKHQQSLGRLDEARASFARCLALATEAAAAAGTPAAVVAGATEGYLIAAGYVALLDNDTATLRALRSVLDTWTERGGEAKADAGIIRRQLRETGRQLSVAF